VNEIDSSRDVGPWDLPVRQGAQSRPNNPVSRNRRGKKIKPEPISGEGRGIISGAFINLFCESEEAHERARSVHPNQGIQTEAHARWGESRRAVIDFVAGLEERAWSLSEFHRVVVVALRNLQGDRRGKER
jgi:hypothetical protein